MTKDYSLRYPLELRQQLREDILERYDNEEYWDMTIVAEFHEVDISDLENMCDICHKQEDDDGRCGCTNKDSE